MPRRDLIAYYKTSRLWLSAGKIVSLSAPSLQGLDQLKVLQDDLTQSTKEMVEYSKRHFEAEADSVDALAKLNEETSR